MPVRMVVRWPVGGLTSRQLMSSRISFVWLRISSIEAILPSGSEARARSIRVGLFAARTVIPYLLLFALIGVEDFCGRLFSRARGIGRNVPGLGKNVCHLAQIGRASCRERV